MAGNSILSPTNNEAQKKRNIKRQAKSINGIPLQVAQIIEQQVIKRAKYNINDEQQQLLQQQLTTSSTNQV